MNTFALIATIFTTALLSVSGFAPVTSSVNTGARAINQPLYAVFEEKEREALTRESEPEEYFQT